MKFIKKIMITILSGGLIALPSGGCGTRDYGPDTVDVDGRGASEDTQPARDTRPAKDPKTMEEDIRRGLSEQIEAQEQRQRQEPEDMARTRGDEVGLQHADDVPQEGVSGGYIWQGLEWVGLPDEMIWDFQDRLQDDIPARNNFAAFGTAVIGGAILGVVIRVSGSWFFGGPIKPQEHYWLWRKLDQSLKGFFQGMVRGGILAGGCYLLLTGVDPVPYRGIFGQDFAALSAATVVGAMGAGASVNFIDKLINLNMGQPHSRLLRSIDRKGVISRGLDGIQHWSTATTLGQGLRYKVIPGLVIVGVGSGVGVLVYNEIQD